ncbi:hypothetical protein [Actinoplanes solisilvae]|uniref:hypothetical protein n=1 Tax=Actinoplanes solisilvae TaxID=2486853 RepID=UPI0013E3A149|nr:hypothetical protein [Actinoplanes solisilvae]
MALAAVFELVNRQAVSEASLLSFKVSSLGFVLLGVPVLIAYLLYEAAAYTVESNNLHWVHRKVVEKRYPTAAASDVDLFAIPVDDPFGQAMRDIRFRRRSRLLTVAAWMRFPILVIVPAVAAYAFEVYAFVQLLRHDRVSLALIVVAASASFVLLVLSVSRVATEGPHGGAPWSNGKRAGHPRDVPPV